MASVDQRLTSVEVEVKNIKSMIGNVMSKQSEDHDLLNTVSTQIGAFCTEVKDIKDDAKDKNKTNWGRVWAVIMVLIASVVAAFCTMVLNTRTAKTEAKEIPVRVEKEKSNVPQDPANRG